jgi:hypothetical protein
VPADPSYIKRVAYIQGAIKFKPLIDSGFLENPLALASESKQLRTNALPETETYREEERREYPSLRSGKLESDWPTDFREQFWQAYPRRVEKKAAFKKLELIFARAEVPWEKFINSVKSYAAAGFEPQYIKHPTAWLNKGCWDDDPQPKGTHNGKARTVQDAARDFLANVRAGNITELPARPSGGTRGTVVKLLSEG